ncbi:hypothetical protein C0Q70_09351 [Pomacea canaliculata]|uniref:Uncharacterized protein n=1 Tax=Pomacea canaliculata TaxID=400727 RepID=A0A2T7P9J4_POMCA|nr:hypothetical protein C0Q70_09351 [Pomacea canaliculata]
MFLPVVPSIALVCKSAFAQMTPLQIRHRLFTKLPSCRSCPTVPYSLRKQSATKPSVPCLPELHHLPLPSSSADLAAHSTSLGLPRSSFTPFPSSPTRHWQRCVCRSPVHAREQVRSLPRMSQDTGAFRPTLRDVERCIVSITTLVSVHRGATPQPFSSWPAVLLLGSTRGC